MSGMTEVLIKATAFIMIIATGYGLKRAGIFQADDFHLLSKIVVRITLPAAIVSNFSSMNMDNTLLVMCVIGLLANIIMVGLGYLTHLGRNRKEQAFAMLNVSGYNIGNFTLPFIQNFLGPVGFAVTSLFDAGNALMCTGATYTAASMVSGGGEKASVKGVLKSLFSSVPFDMYIIMTVLSVLGLRLPKLLVSYAGTIGNANAFLALFMIGIGFELQFDKKQLAEIAGLLVLRYGTALIFSAAAYWLLPFTPEIRVTLAVIAFGPISSVSPAFTGRLGGDVGMASTINSLSIIASIISITIALIVFL